MSTIRPSEGTQNTGETVFVEGVIAGQKSRSNVGGGRYIVGIADDEDSQKAVAVMALNLEPTANSAIAGLGIEKPTQSVLRLFHNEEYAGLFRRGRRFKAEAIVGIFEGQAWFNVGRIILFDPEFSIGARQFFRQSMCERRLLLDARGVEGYREKGDKSGAIIFGNILHNAVQELMTLPDRQQKFHDSPGDFLLRGLQFYDLLSAGMMGFSDSDRLWSGTGKSVEKRIEAFLQSPTIQEVLSPGADWASEVPVAGGVITGDIDLRTTDRIVELKSGRSPGHEKSRRNQLFAYLVGEMLEHGSSIGAERTGYICYALGVSAADEDRVYKVPGNDPEVLAALDQLILERHRRLLVSGGELLPKISLPPKKCQDYDCQYYLPPDDIGQSGQSDRSSEVARYEGSACHFYCQTDRSWSCDGCEHADKCTEHSKYHSFDVLDEANRIRTALVREVNERHGGYGDYAMSSSMGTFKIDTDAPHWSLALEPVDGIASDPPTVGEKISLMSDKHLGRVEVLMAGTDESNRWIVSGGGDVLGRLGRNVHVRQLRSELKGIHYLQKCVDQLQRPRSISGVSNRAGIAFGGGNLISGRPLEADDLSSVLADSSVTDIFYQSFSVARSKRVLVEALGSLEGRKLVITDAQLPSEATILDLRRGMGALETLEGVSGLRSVDDAFKCISTLLETRDCWTMSPDMVLDEDICENLPSQGRNFFDHIVVYETHSITGLEYFLLRRLGKRMLTIGDANCVGRRLLAEESVGLGLGDNVLTRVYTRGFPREDRQYVSKLVCDADQELDTRLNKALGKCRLVNTVGTNSKVSISFEVCDESESSAVPVLLYEYVINNGDAHSSFEIDLRIDRYLSDDEFYDDLRELEAKINLTLTKGKELVAPTSGRRYVATGPMRALSGEGGVVVRVITDQSVATSPHEAAKVLELLREFLGKGVKPKNIAIMSTSRDQLELIGKDGGDDIAGVALRTPYGIHGETWGSVLVSCATGSAKDIAPRELYTMIRAAGTRVVIIGSQGMMDYHPLLREMNN